MWPLEPTGSVSNCSYEVVAHLHLHVPGLYSISTLHWNLVVTVNMPGWRPVCSALVEAYQPLPSTLQTLQGILKTANQSRLLTTTLQHSCNHMLCGVAPCSVSCYIHYKTNHAHASAGHWQKEAGAGLQGWRGGAAAPPSPSNKNVKKVSGEAILSTYKMLSYRRETALQGAL